MIEYGRHLDVAKRLPPPLASMLLSLRDQVLNPLHSEPVAARQPPKLVVGRLEPVDGHGNRRHPRLVEPMRDLRRDECSIAGHPPREALLIRIP